MKKTLTTILVSTFATLAPLEAEKISPFANAETGEPLPAVDSVPVDSMTSMEEAMNRQMKRMVEVVMDEQLRFLEKPDTLKRIATIAKNYRKELIEAGFSKEEAIQIISRSSLLPSLSQK